MSELDRAIVRYAEAVGAPVEVAAEELAVYLDDIAQALDAGAMPVADQEALERIDTPTSPTEAGLAVPWLRGEAALHRMRSTAVALGEVAARLDVSDSALRRVIGSTTGLDVELLGFKDSRGAWRVFAYQLPGADGGGGEPATRVGRRVQRALPPGMSPVAVAAWWDAPNAALYLDGRELSPRRWVADGLDPDQVVAAAEHEDAA